MAPDMTDQYNTQLSPEEEKAFKVWAGKRASDVYDYDMRGAYKEFGKEPMSPGHLPDTYKKPNHPTFSNESMYHGKDGHIGGEWEPTGDMTPDGKPAQVFLPGPTNYWNSRELEDYFQKAEPGNQIAIPEGRE